MNFEFQKKALRGLTALGLVGALGACSDFLTVQNPGAINEENLNDTTVLNELATSGISDFNRMYAGNAYAGAILSDEAVTGHNFTEWQEFDLRIVRQSNSVLPDIYVPLQRTRFSTEDMAARLKALLGGAAATDIRVARALAYAGYANTIMAETLCMAPVAPDQPALNSQEIFARAVPFYQEAIQIATANRAAQTTAAGRAEADQVLNLARVGLARTYLNMNNRTEAANTARLVSPDFVARVVHSDTKSYLENPFFSATSGTNRNLGVDQEFLNLNDPRVRHTGPGVGHNGTTVLYTPAQPPSFSGYTEGTPVAFGRTTAVRFSSGLEAQYIVAEAEGLNAVNLAFLQSRQAAGNQTITTPTTDAEFRAALRDQRRRDFFLDGHRLGDIRRYKAFYGIDEFPTGDHPNPSFGEYGTAECYIPDRNEAIGNPQYG